MISQFVLPFLLARDNAEVLNCFDTAVNTGEGGSGGDAELIAETKMPSTYDVSTRQSRFLFFCTIHSIYGLGRIYLSRGKVWSYPLAYAATAPPTSRLFFVSCGCSMYLSAHRVATHRMSGFAYSRLAG